MARKRALIGTSPPSLWLLRSSSVLSSLLSSASGLAKEAIPSAIKSAFLTEYDPYGRHLWLEGNLTPLSRAFLGPFFVLYEAKARNVVTFLAPSSFSPKKLGAQGKIDPRITTGVFPLVPIRVDVVADASRHFKPRRSEFLPVLRRRFLEELHNAVFVRVLDEVLDNGAVGVPIRVGRTSKRLALLNEPPAGRSGH